MRSSLSLKDSSTGSEEKYFLKLNANLPAIERVGVDEGPGRTPCLKSCWQPGFMMVREPSTRLADRRGGLELELLVTLGDFLTISKVLGSPREKEQILLS
jgi:hypothetical protein